MQFCLQSSAHILTGKWDKVGYVPTTENKAWPIVRDDEMSPSHAKRDFSVMQFKNKLAFEPLHDQTNKMTSSPSEDSDQPVQYAQSDHSLHCALNG